MDTAYFSVAFTCFVRRVSRKSLKLNLLISLLIIRNHELTYDSTFALLGLCLAYNSENNFSDKEPSFTGNNR
jgi:hypothetical protein